MTEQSIVTICTGVGSVLTLLIVNYFAQRKLVNEREQDRLDRITDAEIIRENQKAILAAGDSRKEAILGEVRQVKTVAVKAALKSEEAIRVANGHNEKIADAVTVSKQLLEKLDAPISVTVDNDPHHPIPVENHEPATNQSNPTAH